MREKREADTCSYQCSSPDATQPSTAEDRLAHLESLVRDLIQGSATTSTAKSSASDIQINSSYDSNPRTPAHIADSEPGTRNAGSTHWSVILDDIHGIKAALGQHDYFPESGQIGMSSASPCRRDIIIFGSANNYPMKMIISHYLPSKLEVDRLLAVYFQGEAFIIPFIHATQFQHQYRAFWEDPAASNPLWLSILFSICSAATMVLGMAGIAPTTREDAMADVRHFQEVAGKCLIRGEYHRPQQYVLEALTLYAQTINMQSLDPSREVGAIFGMILRMAYEMGYHRDPDSLGSITIFEGGMRRRFWALCKQVDLMVSFQLGLPSNICLENCDTQSPRNLVDSEFDRGYHCLASFAQ